MDKSHIPKRQKLLVVYRHYNGLRHERVKRMEGQKTRKRVHRKEGKCRVPKRTQLGPFSVIQKR